MNVNWLFTAHLNRVPSRFPEDVVFNHREIGGQRRYAFDDQRLLGVHHQAVGNPQPLATRQTEPDIPIPYHHPFRPNIIRLIKSHGTSRHIGNGDIPQEKSYRIINLNPRRRQLTVQYGPIGQRICAPLNNHGFGIQASPGVRLCNPPRIHAGVAAGININDIATFQIILGQQAVEVRHRGRISQSAILVIAHCGTIHVAYGRIVIDIEIEGPIAYRKERAALGFGTIWTVTDNLECPLNRLLAQRGIPNPFSCRGGNAIGQQCP